MAVVTTLNFGGRTEEAIEFYQRTLGAETLFLMRFRDSPDPSHHDPGMEDKIFHATFRVAGTELMASDVGLGRESPTPAFEGFALLLRLDSVDQAERIFRDLSEGGSVVIPLAESAFTVRYGMLTDRFGVRWKVNVATKP